MDLIWFDDVNKVNLTTSESTPLLVHCQETHVWGIPTKGYDRNFFLLSTETLRFLGFGHEIHGEALQNWDLRFWGTIPGVQKISSSPRDWETLQQPPTSQGPPIFNHFLSRNKQKSKTRCKNTDTLPAGLSTDDLPTRSSIYHLVI